MTPRTLLDFLAVAERLKNRTRHSVTSEGRPESVAEHSWRLALMALMMKDELRGIDAGRVIEMSLVHDLGEAVTGDIPTFLKTRQDEAVENDAVAGLLAMLPDAERAGIKALFDEMEAQETPEAKAWKALDKMEAVIQHNEAPISSWLPLEYDLQLNHGAKESAFLPCLAALREEVRQDTLGKIAAEGKAE